MEKAAAIKNSRNVYRPTGNSGPRQSSVSELIKVSDCLPIHSKDRRLQSWSEHLKEPSFKPDLSLTPANETMQVDTKTSIRNGGFSKGYKTAEPDGLPPHLFNDGDKVLTTK